MRNKTFPPNIATYANAEFTRTEIFFIHHPSKSVLLFSPTATTLGGFVYNHEDNLLLEIEKSKNKVIEKTGIIPNSSIYHAQEAAQSFIMINGVRKSIWIYPIFVKDFSTNGDSDTPPNSKWYSFNVIPYSRIEPDTLRILLKRAVRST